MTSNRTPGTTTKTILLALALAGGAGCGEDGADDPRATGRSSFESPAGSLGGGSTLGPPRGSNDSVGSGGPAPAIPSGQAPPTTSPAPQQMVEEGDIVKVVGSTLYVLNQYRGLQVVDLTNPDQPALASRAAIYGRPLEMYVRGNFVYALVSDYWDYWRCDTCEGGARPYHGSTLAVIDVSNPRSALLVGKLDLPGVVATSRLVGDVMYVVAERYAYALGSTDTTNATVVTSIDVKDASKPRQVAQLDLPRGSWETHIHATDKLLYLAASGYGQFVDGVCTLPNPMPLPPSTGGDDDVPTAPPGTSTGAPVPGTAPSSPPSIPPIAATQCSRIAAIDISAPTGAITMGATADVEGRVLDRWSMDWSAGFFRMVTSNQQTRTIDPPKLRVFRAGGAKELAAVATVPIMIPKPESVTAVRFDGARGFVVTFERIDPLWTLDLGNPEKPFVAGHLETPGWLDHIEVRGNRFVALGHDRDKETSPWMLHVSVYDVADLAKPRMLDRELFGDGFGTMLPGSRDDFQKVFKVLDAEKLALVPFRTFGLWEDGAGRTTKGERGGVQLMDFDLAAGTVTKRGLIAHAGAVERAVPYRDRIVTVSPERLQVIDAKDRDQPKLTGSVELARNVGDVAVAGNTAVTMVNDHTVEGGATDLYLTSSADIDVGKAQAKLSFPGVQSQIFSGGAFTYLVTNAYTAGTTETRIDVVESAGTLRKRGSVKLPKPASLYGLEESVGGLFGTVTQVGPTTLVLAYDYQCRHEPQQGGGTPGIDVPPDRGGSGGAATPGTATPPQDASAVGSTPAMPRVDAGSGTSTPSTPGMDGGAPPDAAVAPPPPARDPAPQPQLAEPDQCMQPQFVVVDLANPDAPVVASTIRIPDAAAVLGVGASGRTFFVDHIEEVAGRDANNRVVVKSVRYFVTRVDLSKPGAPVIGKKVNVPGMFVLARDEDRTLFTVEPRFDAMTGKETTTFSALYNAAGSDRAYLQGQLTLDGGVSNFAVDRRAAFTMLNGKLTVIDLADPKNLRVAAQVAVPGVVAGTASTGGAASSGPRGSTIYYGSGFATVRLAAHGHLFVAVSSGFLVYDVRDPAKPALLQFLRTGGSAGKVRVAPDGSAAYFPAGLYGVQALPLGRAM